jgi:hypothetical protein
MFSRHGKVFVKGCNFFMSDSKSILEVSQATLSKYRELLIEHFSEMPKYSNEPEKQAEIVIQSAISGNKLDGTEWRRAPKSFRDRIEKLAKLGANSAKGASKTSVAAKQKKIWTETKKLINERKYKGSISQPILSNLTPEGKKYFLERENFYYDEFEFNQSSDYVTLMGLIADELLYQKLYEMQLKEPSDKLSKQLSETHNRLVKSQEILGITRKQRESENTKFEGSISDLSVEIDRKLEEREKAKKLEIQQENYLMQAREEREEEFMGIKTGNRISDADLKKLVKRQ